MSNTDESNFYSVMLIDDNEIDNLINQKMIEAASITKHIYTHTGARSAIEFLKNVEKLEDISDQILPDVIFLRGERTRRRSRPAAEAPGRDSGRWRRGSSSRRVRERA